MVTDHIDPSQVPKGIADAMSSLLWLHNNGADAGLQQIIAERRHQIELSYDVAHDRGHEPGWLGAEAVLDAAAATYMVRNDPQPADAAPELARAGALLAAQIDVLA